MKTIIKTSARTTLELISTTKRMNWNSKRRYSLPTQFKFL